MLMKNCNAFDFTHKQLPVFKTLMRNNLGGRPFKVGGPVHLHIPKATTHHWLMIEGTCLLFGVILIK